MSHTVSSIAERAEVFGAFNKLNGCKKRTVEQRRADIFARIHKHGLVLRLAKGCERPLDVEEFRAVLDEAKEKRPRAYIHALQYLNRTRRGNHPVTVPWKTMRFLRTGKIPGIDMSAGQIKHMYLLKNRALNAEVRARA